MSDRQWLGIFSIAASGYLLYVARYEPRTAEGYFRTFMEMTGLIFPLALVAAFALIGVLLSTGLFLLLLPRKRSD